MEGSYERLLAADQSRGGAYVDPGWLPPESECAELAELRSQHLRLLGVVNDAGAKLNALHDEAKSVEARKAEATRDAILAGDDPAKVKVSGPSEVALADARRTFQAATAALEQFVGTAVQEIGASASTIETNIKTRLRVADEKRYEARRLLAEAEQLAAEPKRLRDWLSRYTGKSVLGPVAFSLIDLPLPVAPPELFAEIVLGPAEVMDVGDDTVILEEEREAIHAIH